MAFLRFRLARPIVAAAAVWANSTLFATDAGAGERLGNTACVIRVAGRSGGSPRIERSVNQTLPLDSLPVEVRDPIRRVVEQPTLSARGPAETFRGSPSVYDWLLDHPDRTAAVWRHLGASELVITDRGGGFFSWTDGQGSDVSWQTVVQEPHLRVWYAEGAFKPDTVLPLIHFKSVVVLRYVDGHDDHNRAVIRHQADVYLKTDSKVARLVARVLGPSAPRMAQQGAEQLEMFFSALTWYFEKHPEKAEALLLGDLPAETAPPRLRP